MQALPYEQTRRDVSAMTLEVAGTTPSTPSTPAELGSKSQVGRVCHQRNKVEGQSPATFSIHPCSTNGRLLYALPLPMVHA